MQNGRHYIFFCEMQVEMILQAHEYETAQGASLQEFFDSTRGKFYTPIGQSWAAEICSRRDKQKQQLPKRQI